MRMDNSIPKLSECQKSFDDQHNSLHVVNYSIIFYPLFTSFQSWYCYSQTKAVTQLILIIMSSTMEVDPPKDEKVSVHPVSM